MAAVTSDIPLIARRSRRDPAETRRLLGVPAGRPLVLASFGAYGAPLPYDAIRATGQFTLLSVEQLPPHGLEYQDLVAAADVVVSKPGYGIVSECIANDTALLYTSRGHFIEYDVFVAEMPRVRSLPVHFTGGSARRPLDRRDFIAPRPTRSAGTRARRRRRGRRSRGAEDVSLIGGAILRAVSSSSAPEDQPVPHNTSRLLRLARAADILAAVLVAIGTIAMSTSGMEFQIGFVHLSMRSAWRPYLWALIVLGIRHWFVAEPATLDCLSRRARGPLPFDERSLFGESLTWPQRIGRLALLVFGFSVLAAALTWPQVRHLDSVPDIGDPLFSIWRIAWVSHQIVRDPLRLFDGNMFYPERLTLTYSDSVIVPSLMSAPLFWMGVHPVLIYNLLLLSGFVFSGVTMFLLVRALTGRIDAA